MSDDALDGLTSNLRPGDAGTANPVPRGRRARGQSAAPTAAAWDKLLESYRESPSVAVAARHADVTPYTARRAWKEGWPGLFPALSVVVEEEKAEAARRLTAERAAEARRVQDAAAAAEAKRADEAREAAIAQRVNAGKVIELGRANVLLINNLAVPVLMAMQGEVARITAELPNMTPTDLLRSLRTITGLVARSVEAGRLIADMEKIHTGGAPAAGAGIAMQREELEQELQEFADLLGLDPEEALEAAQDRAFKDGSDTGLRDAGDPVVVAESPALPGGADGG